MLIYILLCHIIVILMSASPARASEFPKERAMSSFYPDFCFVLVYILTKFPINLLSQLHFLLARI